MLNSAKSVICKLVLHKRSIISTESVFSHSGPDAYHIVLQIFYKENKTNNALILLANYTYQKYSVPDYWLDF